MAVWSSGARSDVLLDSRNRVTVGVLCIVSVSMDCGLENTVSWVLNPDGPVWSASGVRAVAVSHCTLRVVVCAIELRVDRVSDARSMGRNWRTDGAT